MFARTVRANYIVYMRYYIFSWLILLPALLFGPASTAQARQDDARLGGLFSILETAETYEAGKSAEGDIWRIWLETGSDTTDYLLVLGMQFMQRGRFDDALRTFTSVTEMDPDFAEGWNKRATVLFLMGEYEYSIVDIYRTLSLEPRHFGALAGLGQIFERQEKLENAVTAFERAARINPHMRSVHARIELLKKRLKDKNI